MTALDLAVVATTFALIFPAELPDKTFIATLVLATRYRQWPVWLGVSAAFAIQVAIAVTAGGLLSLLPATLVRIATAGLFAVGSVILIRGGLSSRAAEAQAEEDEEREVLEKVDDQSVTSTRRIVITSFVVLFTAEWGDLSQLLTAGLAASTGEPLSVGLGSWAALITVAGLAVVFGRWLQQHVPIWRIRLVSGAILAALAIWSVLEIWNS